MTCPRCGKANEPGARFCSRCGIEMASVVTNVATDQDARPCYRHPKEMTLVSCGRCDKPLCHRCIRIGAAGTRCPDCARNDIPFSWRGALHGVQRNFRALFTGRNAWSLYLIIMILVTMGGFLRGCSTSRQPPPMNAPYEGTSETDWEE